MPTLVIYDTNYGHTQRVAESIARQLKEHDVVSTVRFDRFKPPTIPLYETVVLLQSIRMGQVQPYMRTWVNTHAEELMNIKLYVGISCGFPENIERYLAPYNQDLIKHALVTTSIGGTLDDKHPWFDNFIVKMVIKEQTRLNRPLPETNQTAIDSLVATILDSYTEHTETVAD